MPEDTPVDVSAQGKELAHWTEWRERCALGLCSTDAQQELQRFAGMRMRRYVMRYAHKTNAPDIDPGLSHADAWHLLETHLMVRNSREGKRYKEWLFGRASGENTLDAVLGGASLLMRDVAREHLRREYSPPHLVSLSKPLAASAGPALTVEDLLPGSADPRDQVAEREFKRLAAERARAFFQVMDERERVAFLAKALELPLSHPVVEKAAGCRKSVLNETFRACFERLATRLRSDYANEDVEAVRMLVLMTYRELTMLVRAWGDSPGCVPHFFSLAEVR